MTLHDPFAGESRETTRRSFLLRGFARRPRTPRAVVTAPSGPTVRAHRRDQRRLTAIDRRLVSETPQLASMFALFNRLNPGELTVGVEQLPPPRRRRLRPAYLAVLVALAAVAALCFALTTQVHAVVRPCPGSSVSAAVPTVPVSAGCSTYATNSGTTP